MKEGLMPTDYFANKLLFKVKNQMMLWITAKYIFSSNTPLNACIKQHVSSVVYNAVGSLILFNNN